MKMKAIVDIHNDQSKFMVSPKLKWTIKEAVYSTLIYLDFECPETTVSVTLVDDEKIHAINLEHRQKDSATDVLSFPLIDWDNLEDGDEICPPGVPLFLGDIVLSLETAKRQAFNYDQTMLREIAFLTVHSTLHLMGFDHETSPENEREMFAIQDIVMESMGYEKR